MPRAGGLTGAVASRDCWKPAEAILPCRADGQVTGSRGCGTVGWSNWGPCSIPTPSRETISVCSLLMPISSILHQSCWPATTMKTFISSTPLTAMEQSTSRDTRDIAIMPLVRTSWDRCWGRPPPGRLHPPLQGSLGALPRSLVKLPPPPCPLPQQRAGPSSLPTPWEGGMEHGLPLFTPATRLWGSVKVRGHPQSNLEE